MSIQAGMSTPAAPQPIKSLGRYPIPTCFIVTIIKSHTSTHGDTTCLCRYKLARNLRISSAMQRI